jgi:hypothetical protein
VGHQSALHNENSGIAAPTPGRHISTFRGYRIIEPGDAVMIDKGFIQLKSDLEKKNAKMYCPPFMSSKAQFSKAEVELSRHIASAKQVLYMCYVVM